MLLSFTKRAHLVAALLASLSCAVAVDAEPTERQRLLVACAREFGRPVDRAQNLFTINQAFVLQTRFNRQGLLTQFVVEPKYFFNEFHPEWKEPDPDTLPFLSWIDFTNLLVRLDSLKSKGTLTKRADDIAGNRTGYFKETYERGSLEWGEVAIGMRGKPGNGIRFFTVRYFVRAT